MEPIIPALSISRDDPTLLGHCTILVSGIFLSRFLCKVLFLKSPETKDLSEADMDHRSDNGTLEEVEQVEVRGEIVNMTVVTLQ